MGNIKKYISVFSRSLLFFLFIGYYISIAMLYHIHMVNGYVISHSHPFKHYPFKKGPFESHSHSSAAYNHIQQLNKVSWESASTIPQIPKLTFLLPINKSEYVSADVVFNLWPSVLLRSPPRLSISTFS